MESLANTAALDPLRGTLSHLDAYGYVLVPGVFDSRQCDEAVTELEAALNVAQQGAGLRSRSGGVYGARKLLEVWPGVATVWRRSLLPEVLAAVLGPHFGLVRVLYFDKPPGGSWSLPWHKDLTIAVREHRPGSAHFGKPTVKAGVPHVEAPEWLLEKMLTLRWHLDPACEENGALKILPGTHRDGKRSTAEEAAPVTIVAQRGDVLLMRPLVSHASNASLESTTLHRRILHFEFSGVDELPDGYRWHDFVRG